MRARAPTPLPFSSVCTYARPLYAAFLASVDVLCLRGGFVRGKVIRKELKMAGAVFFREMRVGRLSRGEV